MTAISRSALVPYSAGQMYALVADIPAYPQFLSWCGDTRVLSQSEDIVVAAISIRYGGLHKTFTTRNLLYKNKMMEMRLVDGPFSHLHGYWRFRAMDDTSCNISLDLDFDVANRMFGLVLGRVFVNIANQMVDSFRQRAAQLYGPRP